MLIYAFRDARGTWHGDPDIATHGVQPARGALTLPPTARGEEPGLFDGERVEVLYAACDMEASETSYRLDSGDTFPATWHVHELLSPAYQHVPPAHAAEEREPATVRLEIGGSSRRYNLHADLLPGGRVEITVVVCTPDGVVRGELTGELEARDLGEVSRLLASAPLAVAPVASTPIAAAPVASAPIASHPVADDFVPSAPVASAKATPSRTTQSTGDPSMTPAASGTSAPGKATRHGQAWTAETLAQLKEHHRTGKSPEQLARQLGRSEKSIRWKLYGLKLAPYPGDLVPEPRPPAQPEEPKAYTVEAKREQHPNAYKPWEPGDELRLAERCAQGASLSELSREFGRNEGAIASRLLKIKAEGPAVEAAWEYGG
ncbi:hypothetical protein ACFV14_34915 [Streptomyces zaomyceticus]|uniref:hypothetical protein n=1 Tax=Streptomyces zaomyceticus TaxID=68286 RepID=UPI00368296EA